jgi:hypothetical protein
VEDGCQLDFKTPAFAYDDQDENIGLYGPNDELFTYVDDYEFNYYLETTEGKKAIIAFEGDETYWDDVETGMSCELFFGENSDTPYISEDCELRPWDDLTTFFENEDDEEPTSMNGPGGEVYYFQYEDKEEEEINPPTTMLQKNIATGMLASFQFLFLLKDQ